MDTFSDSRVTSDTCLPWGRGGLNSDVPKMFRSVSLTKKLSKCRNERNDWGYDSWQYEDESYLDSCTVKV